MIDRTTRRLVQVAKPIHPQKNPLPEKANASPWQNPASRRPSSAPQQTSGPKPEPLRITHEDFKQVTVGPTEIVRTEPTVVQSVPQPQSDFQPPPPYVHAPQNVAYHDEFVTIDGNMNVQFRINSAQEGALAIKKLQLFKRTAKLRKKDVELAMRDIRADYTAYTRVRGSKMRGGGSIGRFVRDCQTISRDYRRASLAENLAPFEYRRAAWDRLILTIDACVLAIESHYARL